MLQKPTMAIDLSTGLRQFLEVFPLGMLDVIDAGLCHGSFPRMMTTLFLQASLFFSVSFFEPPDLKAYERFRDPLFETNYLAITKSWIAVPGWR
ncbi:hypothetical protein FM113_09515 [Leucobacter sp. 7(1)]|nr:hypothetical protein FM113_09515 [Leucobacter sp. 7(1)]